MISNALSLIPTLEEEACPNYSSHFCSVDIYFVITITLTLKNAE